MKKYSGHKLWYIIYNIWGKYFLRKAHDFKNPKSGKGYVRVAPIIGTGFIRYDLLFELKLSKVVFVTVFADQFFRNYRQLVAELAV